MEHLSRGSVPPVSASAPAISGQIGNVTPMTAGGQMYYPPPMPQSGQEYYGGGAPPQYYAYPQPPYAQYYPPPPYAYAYPAQAYAMPQAGYAQMYNAPYDQTVYPPSQEVTVTGTTGNEDTQANVAEEAEGDQTIYYWDEETQMYFYWDENLQAYVGWVEEEAAEVEQVDQEPSAALSPLTSARTSSRASPRALLPEQPRQGSVQFDQQISWRQSPRNLSSLQVAQLVPQSPRVILSPRGQLAALNTEVRASSTSPWAPPEGNALGEAAMEVLAATERDTEPPQDLLEEWMKAQGPPAAVPKSRKAHAEMERMGAHLMETASLEGSSQERLTKEPKAADTAVLKEKRLEREMAEEAKRAVKGQRATVRRLTRKLTLMGKQQSMGDQLKLLAQAREEAGGELFLYEC
eukprot:Gregarina_sp_Poly_1__6451@NODE_344_length_9409_cov_268_562406_g288_i0_p3_GENE_NODE_344_length_9409_cov_268_562406_g288_i0NODE_344_length_9409_cov_268_562406_g288_i0_p3_ORF_typecomplete_len406_score72_85_NODE_344_length_9409_cov_268_562406_g288_i059867203